MQQVTAFNELLLHHFWKNQPIPGMYKSTCGKSIRVLFPGWYNQGSGPDFKNATIIINSTECFGDIELHTNESYWFSHQHQKDTAYNKVLLHVFINPSNINEKLTETGTVIPIQLPEALIMPLMSKSKKELLKNIQGACGISISDKNLRKFKKIVVSAAETRLMNKGRIIKADLKNALAEGKEEQLLYEKLFEAMGSPNFKGIFHHISVVYPYQRYLQDIQSHDFDEAALINLWKEKFIGIYKKQKTDNNSENAQTVFTGIYNNPTLRFTILIKLLNGTKHRSLLNALMYAVNSVGRLFSDNTGNVILNKKSSPITRKKLLLEFHKLFETPSELTGNRKAISDNRLIILLANAVIPYFIAWAELHNDEVLKQTLFNLFITLPGENSNRKINFMKTRLGITANQLTVSNSLREYQGLIQLHDDCCHHFSRGCTNCVLVNMLTDG